MVQETTTEKIPAIAKRIFLPVLGIALIAVAMRFLGIFPELVVLFILFVFILPPLLYLALKKIADPVPLWVSPLFAVIVLGFLYTGIISSDNAYENNLILFALIFLISTFAVIGPYPFFEKKIRIQNPWKLFPFAAFIGTALFLIATMGEIYAGRPWSAFSSSLPLTGWILDGLANLLQVQGTVYAYYSHVYRTLWACGFYLEIFIIAVVYYAVLARLYPAGTGQEQT